MARQQVVDPLLRSEDDVKVTGTEGVVTRLYLSAKLLIQLGGRCSGETKILTGKGSVSRSISLVEIQYGLRVVSSLIHSFTFPRCILATCTFLLYHII